MPSGPTLLIAETDHTVGVDGLIRMSRPALERYFYDGLPQSLRSWACSQIRPLAARALGPERIVRLDPRPPLAYIVCTGDRPFLQTGSVPLRSRLSECVLTSSPVDTRRFLSRPDELAELLVDIACDLATSI
jgi:hypothetical protein